MFLEYCCLFIWGKKLCVALVVINVFTLNLSSEVKSLGCIDFEACNTRKESYWPMLVSVSLMWITYKRTPVLSIKA